MLTDGYVTGFGINVWESKIIKKLVANANHYSIKVLCMVYIDSCMDEEIYKLTPLLFQVIAGDVS